MKKTISIVFAALLPLCAPAADTARLSDCGAYAIAFSSVTLKPISASEGVKTERGFFEDFGKKKNVIRAFYKTKADAWETVSFKFLAERDGTAVIGLAGVHMADKDGKKIPLGQYYDNVKVNGKPLPNGDFEQGAKDWLNRGPSSSIVSVDGTRCLRTWSGAYVIQKIDIQAGKTYEVSFSTRPAGRLDTERNDQAIDISKFANFGLADFSKLGAKNNFSKLDTSRTDFGGVNFSLIDPAKNAGKSAVLLDSKVLRNGLKKIELTRLGSGRYIYLLHTSFYGGDSDVNTAVLTVKTAAGDVVKFNLKRREDTWLFEDPREFNENVKPVYRVLPEKKIGTLYFSRFELPKPDAIDSLTLESSGNDAVLLLGASLSDRKVAPFETWTCTEKDWTKADIPAEDYCLKEGSALDLSKFAERAPAGTYGRVIVSERGTLAFEKTPEKDARFKGFSDYALNYFLRMPKEGRDAAIAKYAQAFKLYGYNFARISMEGLRDDMPDAQRAELYDVADRYISELKKNGVNVHLTLVWYRLGLKDYSFYIRDDVKLRAVFGDANVRAHWKKTVEGTLNHVNPYTGFAWKDDPVFACVEYYNELAICFPRMDKTSKFHPLDTILPETDAFVKAKWAQWLKTRYNGDIAALNKAWKGYFDRDFNYKNFGEVECIVKRNPDWERCCWDHLAGFVKFAEGVVDAAGYKGLKVQNNLGTPVYGMAVRWGTTDYNIGNCYFAHPSSFNINDASCSQDSSIFGRVSWWRGITSTKLVNRPFFITEYNHCYWNDYRYEFAATFAPYSAFQNFSGLVIHAGGVPMTPKAPKHVGAFGVSESPVARVAELFSAAMYTRGDVEKARHRIEMEISDDFLKNSPLALRALNTTQTQLLLLTGFASKFQGEVPAVVRNVKLKPADMTITPVGGSETISEAWFESVVEGGAKNAFNIAKFVQAMRKKGILSPDNITDPDKGIFQSDTGQITLYAEKKMMKVVTQRSEIVAIEKSEPVQLGALKVVSTSVPASVGLVAVDGKKLSESDRLVLTYATREGSLGMTLSLDDRVSAGQGPGPIVLLNGVLEAEVKLDKSKKYSVYPLALNGERREKLPFEFADGVMKIRIDNSKLKNGSTAFFEIAAE